MSPNVWIQMQWPPVGIDAIGWEGRALVMSAVLAASYYSANVAMVAKDPKVRVFRVYCGFTRVSG
jgi:cytochrome c oxidase subunit 3